MHCLQVANFGFSLSVMSKMPLQVALDIWTSKHSLDIAVGISFPCLSEEMFYGNTALFGLDELPRESDAISLNTHHEVCL